MNQDQDGSLCRTEFICGVCGKATSCGLPRRHGGAHVEDSGILSCVGFMVMGYGE